MEAGLNPGKGNGVEVRKDGTVRLTREEYRSIKKDKKEDIEALLAAFFWKGAEHNGEKEALLKSREALEQAMEEVKGIGPVKKAEIRKKYREKLEESNESI